MSERTFRTTFDLDASGVCSCRAQSQADAPSAQTRVMRVTPRGRVLAVAEAPASPASPAPVAPAAALPPVEADAAPATAARWRGVLGVEGELTGDGRMIERNALTWDLTYPLPLRYAPVDVGGHDGAVVVGGIDRIERASNGQILGWGTFDTASPEGREALRVVRDGITNGVSFDLDDVSFEVRVAADVLESMGILGEPMPPVEGEGDAEAEEPETDEEGRVTILEVNSGDEIEVATSAGIRAATIVAIPAFTSARIEVDEEDQTAPPPAGASAADGEDDALAASAAGAAASGREWSAPATPPLGWFRQPALRGPTPLTVTDDGRVYGHLAIWGTCHIAHNSGGRCVAPPRSGSGYAYFHTGSVRTAEGQEVPTGHLTLDTRHAGEDLSPRATMAHYEHTGTVVADVVAGEDEHGIWVSGAARPDLTVRQVRALRAAPLSGDWRRIGNHLELVAALGVNVPGFPVPRPRGLVASGKLRSLVASGIVTPADWSPTAPPTGAAPDGAALARRVRASALAMRAHARRAR